MSRGALAIALAVAATACANDVEAPAPCGEIPAGGCPASRGGTCDDATCASIWACLDGTWEHRADCGPRDAGADAPDADGARDAAPDAACGDAAVDVARSTATGCAPDLELPDCPVEAIGACAGAACLTGCDAFFACTPDGWSEQPAATCESGELVVAP